MKKLLYRPLCIHLYATYAEDVISECNGLLQEGSENCWNCRKVVGRGVGVSKLLRLPDFSQE